MNRPCSSFEYAILGLLQEQPLSGYDLRKIFASTPMTYFSNSPGAIYPALVRLKKRGLITSRVEGKSSLRRRRVFKLAPGGLNELKSWLRTPATREDVIWGMDIAALKFSFMSRTLESDEIVRYLENFETELASYITVLRDYLGSQSERLSSSSRLALESGIAGYRSQLRWARRAIRLFKSSEKGVRVRRASN